jgi:protein-S-isoprenylcysteine O-methyltransferase Ste14
MSLPLLFYFVNFLAAPSIVIKDITFFFSRLEGYVILVGFALFMYSLVYQLRHRKMFLQKGPYKYVRHPQYLGIIIMTFGLTALSLNATPIYPNELFTDSWILYIWIIEVLAYIILAKIEEISMKARYGEVFIDYMKKVPFLVPNLKVKRAEERNTLRL